MIVTRPSPGKGEGAAAMRALWLAANRHHVPAAESADPQRRLSVWRGASAVKYLMERVRYPRWRAEFGG